MGLSCWKRELPRLERDSFLTGKMLQEQLLLWMIPSDLDQIWFHPAGSILDHPSTGVLHRVGRDPKDHPIPTPCMDRDTSHNRVKFHVELATCTDGGSRDCLCSLNLAWIYILVRESCWSSCSAISPILFQP